MDGIELINTINQGKCLHIVTSDNRMLYNLKPIHNVLCYRFTQGKFDNQILNTK